MTFAVKTQYNTDENGDWVEVDELEESDIPTTYHGPFDTLEAATEYMWHFQEDDTDVYDMMADDYDIPDEWLNTPPRYTPHPLCNIKLKETST